MSITLGYSNEESPPGMQNDASFRALQYFHAATARTLGGSAIAQVIEAIVRKTAGTTPYLLHMVLAVSTAHFRRLTSAHRSSKNLRCLRITEAVHWQKGLQLYQKRLSLAAFGHEFDSIVATTFLAILFTFAMDDEVPSDAYTASDARSRSLSFGPWVAITGFRALNCVRGALSPESAFSPIVNWTHDVNETLETVSGVEGIPAAFTELCELTPSSNESNNPYCRILHLLAPLLQIENKAENTTKLLAFIGRTWVNLRPLLAQKDTRALLLLSWWLVLLEHVNQWWVVTRARTERKAIVEHLSTCSDPRVQALLVWPASHGSVDCSWIWT
ncbi:uncharacterized protein J7T55_007558 [Diaporthe amygdali]|uniref:uncharacterized protein n=1 Tax=Phomopsis amygdali TaxID=1214568 RepID=UPI0022FDC285|nr:uncharacterized protein J7T55_007558 [Diaporthe amygdali]KAJ0107188.1 uncharacterized protein J7T55_007558 [Diaporthe amygdali]